MPDFNGCIGAISFFLPMVPPTVTHQEHEFKVVRGQVVVYDPPRLRDARQKFTALLAEQARQHNRVEHGEPLLPLDGPVWLLTKWIWPADEEHPDGTWKTSKPDTDNLIKLFKDCMTRTGWWNDDAQVCSEVTEKFYGEKPGIFVRVEWRDGDVG